jgi:hypothetical protein
MIFGYFTLFVALLIEAVGAYYSITGLAAIFSGAVVPILIMGGSLEIGKVTAAVWLKNNWYRANTAYKLYLLPAVAMLMLITSMGIFGFLSKAHSDQSLVSGDVTSKLEIYDEKIKTAKENIESDRKQIKQMDEAVDQVMARSTTEGGADKSNAIRKSQAKDRASLAKDIEANQKIISQLNDQAAPIRAEVRKVEADVGPIKYIAKLIYDDNPDANILEKAVVWVIMLIVAVFDPLALVLILAGQQQIRWGKEDVVEVVEEESDNEESEEQSEEESFSKKILRRGVTNSRPEDNMPLGEMRPLDAVEQRAAEDALYEEYYDNHPAVSNTNSVLDGLNDMWDSSKNSIKQDSEAEHAPIEELVIDEPIDHLAHIEIPEIDPDDFLHRLAKNVFLNGQDERIYHAQHQAGEIDRLPWHDPEHVNNLPISDSERKQLLERFASMAPPPKPVPVTPSLELQADNDPMRPTGEVKGFGTQFPSNPALGDMFLRVDRLPSVLYKFNGANWIIVDKSLTDQHAYNDAYIDHLIEKIDSGEYDPDLLSDAERSSIEDKLRKV